MTLMRLNRSKTMKHLGYIALGFTIMLVAGGFIIALAYLAKTLGALVVLIPILIAMMYALGRSVCEANL